MKAYTDWECIRRQVAVGGRVTDRNNRPLNGVEITIERSVEQGKKRRAETTTEEPVRQAVFRADGLYYFLDLPAGEYVLSVKDPRSGKQEDRPISISVDKEHNIKMMQADFKL